MCTTAPSGSVSGPEATGFGCRTVTTIPASTIRPRPPKNTQSNRFTCVFAPLRPCVNQSCFLESFPAQVHPHKPRPVKPRVLEQVPEIPGIGRVGDQQFIPPSDQLRMRLGRVA